jgi:hypothetical protein
MATDLSTSIETAAGVPTSFSEEGRSVSQRPLTELIAADQYLSGVTARNKRRRGVSFTKLIAPGALADDGGSESAGGNFGRSGSYP